MEKIEAKIRKFKAKIIFESFLKSLILGLLSGSVTTLLFILVCKVVPFKVELLYDLIIFGAVSLFAFLLGFFAFYFPSKKYIYARIDGMGLEERVSTSEALKNNDSEIAMLQKADTLEKLEKQETKKLPFRFPVKLLIALPLAIVLACSSYYVPYREPSISQKGEKTDQEIAEDKFITEMIEEIEQIIEDAEVDEDVKEELKDVIEDLKENIAKDETLEDKIADINAAKEEIEQIISNNLPTRDFGEELQGNETTESLGEALQNGDTEGAKDALEQIKDELNDLEGEEYDEKVDEIVDAIEDALEKIDNDSDLKDAFEEFIRDLEETKNEEDQEKREETLDDIFEKLEEEIEEAVKEDEALEDILEDITEEIEDTMDDLTDMEHDPSESGSMPMGSMSIPEGSMSMPNSGSMPESGSGRPDQGSIPTPGEDRPGTQVPTDNNTGGAGTGEVNHASEEEVYNPGTDTTGSYGDFIDEEYAKALEAFVNGDITEEEWLEIYEYYSKLYKTIEDETPEGEEGEGGEGDQPL